ncbi:hypothetical protein K505DRAFT_392877 [Melanomma pulvis-pyrius CBS 109.77]|uniref:Protein HRI1 n=1 Tax=Melanomma pulvis-pyrius CBS 109.77 TaxID=1314802 RepID=A0A6A6XQ69_9PLEO|nr:hypothetical protein K505DRAFT_392877 [Melanomma pulvis-pyrius CBS 109.77]
MVIKATPQILRRISMRWLPDPAFENTDTIALNVGGYFMDLRVATADESLEWSRAGERKELGRIPLTFQWTRIIDSFKSTQADEAAFETLPNGDDLETGMFTKDGIPTAYEEVWRDVTEDTTGDSYSWIIQSNDGSTFMGKVGNVFLWMRQDEKGSFAARKEIYDESKGDWEMVFESGPAACVPKVEQVQSRVRAGGKAGEKVDVEKVEYVIRGLGLS